MSKVTILSRPNRITIASKGVQGARGPEGPQGEQGERGPMGDVTPEALAARDAAQGAASAAAQSAADAAAAFPGLDARVTDLEENPAFPDAPDDGGAYIRVNGQWVQLYAPLALSGDLPDGAVDEPYSSTLEAAGGRAPYALGDVLLPPGLDATLADASVTVAGTPTEEWEGEAHIDLSDSLGTAIRRVLDVRIDPVPVPAVDLFVVVGQSNAEGRGDSALSPAAPTGLYISGSTIGPLADPVGGANTGSMWPAFANEWYARTGRRAAFVEAAVGGSGLLAEAGGASWSPAGTLRAIAASAANTAIAALGANPGTYGAGDVHFVWSQGETDAAAINGATVTADLYADALGDLADYFKAQVPSMSGLHIVATGGSGTTGPLMAALHLNYAAIRRAQVLEAEAHPHITEAYSGTLGFVSAGLMGDATHYSQAGLNVAGAISARTISAALPAPTAPVQTAFTSYPFTTDANAASRTIAHAFNPATKSVLLFVHTPRSSYPNVTATCGGIPMKIVMYARASNDGMAQVMAFVLNGSGPSGDIVVTSSAALFSIHAAVAEFDSEVWVTGVGSNLGQAAVSAQSHSLFSADPALVYGAVATASAGAATVSMAGLSEVSEASILRATTGKHYTLAIGAAPAAARQAITVGTTHSSTCDTICAISVALRRKLDGE